MWKDSSSIGACVIGRASVVKVHCVMLMRFITGLKCVCVCVGGGGEVLGELSFYNLGNV